MKRIFWLLIVLCPIPAILWFCQFPRPKSVNYEHLEALLVAQDWKAADYETSTLLQEITRNRRGLTEKLIDLLLLDRFRDPIQVNKVPCQDFVLIDRLWSQYSNQQFGFSTQQDIWKTLDPNIVENLDSMEMKYTQAFDSKVSWSARDEATFYGKLEHLSVSQLPSGYLPHQLYYDTYPRKIVEGQGYINRELTILYILSLVESCILESPS